MDDYEIDEKVLGSGQYGIVKLGKYKHSKVQVAIKVIDKRKMWMPSRVQANVPTAL